MKTTRRGLIGRILKARLVRRVVAVSIAVVLALSPVAPWPAVTPANAGLGSCLDAFTDQFNVAYVGTKLATDSSFLACSGQMAASGGADVVLDAAVALMAGFGIGGDFTDRATCEGALSKTIAGPLIEALKLLVGPGSVLGDALAALLGQNAVNQLLSFADNATQSDFNNFISEFLGPLGNDLSCGCQLVGGAMEIGHAIAAEAKDTGECLGALADIVGELGKGLVSAAKWLGKEVGAALGDVEHAAEATYCETIGALLGSCDDGPTPPPENVGTRTGGGLALGCTAGDHFGYVTTSGGYAPACTCYGASHVKAIGARTHCECNDPTLAYGDDSDAKHVGSCIACDGIINADGSCHRCGVAPAGWTADSGVPFEGAAPAGMTYVADRKNNQCHLTAQCNSPEVYDPATGSCSLCPANFAADQHWVVDQYGAAELSLGTCMACPAGTSAPAGSFICKPLNCSLVEQPDAVGGHTCVPCASVGHRLDADVCLGADGKPLYQPQECAWGSSLPLGNGYSYEAAYRPIDCRPLNCKGTDHPDDAGHACIKCQNVVTIPKGMTGEASVAGRMSMSDGTMVSLSNGQMLTFANYEGKGGAPEIRVAGSDGQTHTISKGGGSSGGSGEMVQVCLDPDNNPAHKGHYSPNNWKIPGLQVVRDQPDLKYQDYKPPSAYSSGNLLGNNGASGSDPGNNPIIKPELGSMPGGAAGVGTPMMPGRQPVPPPPPGGGTGRTLPAERDKGYSSRTVPAEGDKGYSSRTVPAEGDKGYSSRTVPAEGDKDVPTSTGPARTSKGNDKGKGNYTTVTVPAEGETPTSTGPARNSKKVGDKPAASPSKGEGYKIAPMGSGGDGSSAKGSGIPQSHPTPGLSNGQPLRPSLNDEPQMRMTPRLNDSPQLRAAPQLNPTPQAGRAPPASGNTTQPERIRPTLNDSRSGPVFNSGTGAPTNPFAR